MTDKKKVNVHSLYVREKKIVIEDDSGNFAELVMTKMTQGQRIDLLTQYVDFLEEEKSRLSAREEKFKTLALSLKSFSKDDFINGIVSFEKAQRIEIEDLYPNLEGKTEEEKKKILEEEYKKFEEKRKEELLKRDIEELQSRFIDLTIESQALLEAARKLNLLSLVYMCLDVETREPIFKSLEDVESVRDRRVLDSLVKELTQFRILETAKEVRKIASSDESFLTVGESQSDSTGSPTTTT